MDAASKDKTPIMNSCTLDFTNSFQDVRLDKAFRMMTAILSHCIISNMNSCVIKAFIEERRERRRYLESNYSIIHYSLIPTNPLPSSSSPLSFSLLPAFSLSLFFFLQPFLKLKVFWLIFILNYSPFHFIYSPFLKISLCKHFQKKDISK